VFLVDKDKLFSVNFCSLSEDLIKFRLNNTRIMSLQGSDFKIYINLPR